MNLTASLLGLLKSSKTIPDSLSSTLERLILDEPDSTSEHLNLLTVIRECHKFTNPHGLWSRVVKGAGTGWQITALKKPAPAAQV